MTVLGNLARRSLENPSTPISSSSISALFAGGRRVRAGVSVTEERAYGLTAYYRAVALMSGTMAALPLRPVQIKSREPVLQTTVLDNPNPGATPFEFWQTVFAHALSWGTGYVRKLRDGSGTVRQVWPIHPSAVEQDLVPPSDANPSGRVYVITVNGQRVRYTDYEITAIPFLSIHGRAGLSPLRLAREVLGIGIAAENAAADFYGSGTQISGILSSKQKLDNDGADRLKSRWREKVGGAANRGDIAVLDADTSFQPISLPPADAQLLESRPFSVTEIARLFGIPPHMLGDVDKTTSWGTGIEEQTLGFVKFTLQPWLTLIEQRVTRDLIAGPWEANYDLAGLERGDSASRSAFYGSGITNGWLSRNEARIAEGKQPADGLDEFIVPSNMTLISVDGTVQPLAPKGPANAD